MHELSLAEELVARCTELAGGRQVLEVHARANFGLDKEEFSEAFPLAAAGGPLKGAVLELELVPARLDCPCGWAGQLPYDFVAGHIGICPGCGRAAELSGGLEVVGLRYAGADGTA